MINSGCNPERWVSMTGTPQGFNITRAATQPAAQECDATMPNRNTNVSDIVNMSFDTYILRTGVYRPENLIDCRKYLSRLAFMFIAAICR